MMRDHEAGADLEVSQAPTLAPVQAKNLARGREPRKLSRKRRAKLTMAMAIHLTMVSQDLIGTRMGSGPNWMINNRVLFHPVMNTRSIRS